MQQNEIRQCALLPKTDLYELPDGSEVMDDQGSVWEKQAGWWRLQHTHTILSTKELNRSSSYLMALQPYYPDGSLK